MKLQVAAAAMVLTIFITSKQNDESLLMVFWFEKTSRDPPSPFRGNVFNKGQMWYKDMR